MNERLRWKSKRVLAQYKAGELAELIGVHNSTLSQYESGSRNLNPDAERRYKALITDRLGGI